MNKLNAGPSDHVEMDIFPDTFFLYKAYMEKSSNGSSLRVLSINRCVDPDTAIEARVGDKWFTLRAQPIEGTCPWIWAPGCSYNSFVFDGIVNDTNTSATHITLLRDGKSVRIPLNQVSRKVKGTLSFCVPPIYWFTDWTKIIFALETWKAQGVRHVFMYYHSSSRHVQDVLQHYQKEGFVTIIRWPSLPRSSFVDPNLSLYRLAHSLAHNDCVLRIDSEFGAVIDVDEIIVPRQGTLLGLLNELFSNSSVGALSFAHRSLRLNPPLAGQNFSFAALNYSGIKNATEFELQGPSKVIFRTEAVDLQATHDVRKYRSSSITLKVPTKDAVLLHHRYNHVTGENPKMVNLLPSGPFINDLLGSLINQTNAIFPKGADFHFNTQKVLGMCLKPWREEQNYCKTPLEISTYYKVTINDVLRQTNLLCSYTVRSVTCHAYPYTGRTFILCLFET
ncbi:hypothetical protein RB195_012691 [Necator americanus]|uniref:Glycosyltransferase family 92 protein n=1 Tax=Necator americanus TaxID=51031 RepID=A0ABR1DS90_NECAM